VQCSMTPPVGLPTDRGVVREAADTGDETEYFKESDNIARTPSDNGGDLMSQQEAQPGALTAGSVVIDIGGDTGAAVISMPDELTGQEVEIRRTGVAWDGTHTGIRRSAALGSYAVFGSLLAGDYEIRIKATFEPVQSLHIRGAEVSQLRWFGVSESSMPRP
jgi:hypothetical protein